jgi:hypothetical protein
MESRCAELGPHGRHGPGLGRAKWQKVAAGWIVLGLAAAGLSRSAAAGVVFATGFESSEGYSNLHPLSGQAGWTSDPYGVGNGVDGLLPGQGQQAYIGAFPPTDDAQSVVVWRPINIDPVAAGTPLVTFTVDLMILGSTSTNHDNFRWSVYNRAGNRLFSVEFDNTNTNIYYLLDDDEGAGVDTEFSFERGGLYQLKLEMDFGSNRWSAALEGLAIVANQPMTTRGATLDLGDVDAAWVIGGEVFGDNYMLFDDYRIVAEARPAPAPRLESLGYLPGAGFALRLTGTAGRAYALEATTDYAAWTSLKTNLTGADGISDYLDSGAGAWPHRFYRAREVGR